MYLENEQMMHKLEEQFVFPALESPIPSHRHNLVVDPSQLSLLQSIAAAFVFLGAVNIERTAITDETFQKHKTNKARIQLCHVILN